MKKIILSSAILPHTMTPEAREATAQRLYKIHSQIFDGVSYENFKRYVVEPNSKETKIWPILNQNGEDVGYITYQVFEAGISRKWWQRSPLVYRTEVGILPNYRSRNLTFRHLLPQYLKGFAMSGFRRSFFVATPVHPVPYKIAAKQCKTIYPAPGQEIPTSIRTLMDSLSDKLGLAPGSGEFEKKVGWIVRDSQQRRERVLKSKDPLVQFYLKQNPGYVKGNGMMMIVPFSLRNAIYAVSNMAGKNLHKAWNRIRFGGISLAGSPRKGGNQTFRWTSKRSAV